MKYYLTPTFPSVRCERMSLIADEQDRKNEELGNCDAEIANESKAEEFVDSVNNMNKDGEQIKLSKSDTNDSRNRKPLLKQLKGKVSSVFRGD